MTYKPARTRQGGEPRNTPPTSDFDTVTWRNIMSVMFQTWTICWFHAVDKACATRSEDEFGQLCQVEPKAESGDRRDISARGYSQRHPSGRCVTAWLSDSAGNSLHRFCTDFWPTFVLHSFCTRCGVAQLLHNLFCCLSPNNARKVLPSQGICGLSMGHEQQRKTLKQQRRERRFAGSNPAVRTKPTFQVPGCRASRRRGRAKLPRKTFFWSASVSGHRLGPPMNPT